jgi:hypothetical protein
MMDRNVGDSEWGKKSGTINNLEYALMNDLVNKSMGEQYKYILDNFPEGHPLRVALRDERITKINPGGGFDALVIRLDDENAIVLFGGTAGYDDIVNDAALAIGVAPPQTADANRLIKELEYAGVKNITVGGHSFGGYLAIDVTLNSNTGTINECVTFDAPGRNLGEAALNSSPNRSKIESYYAKGDMVHTVGTSPVTQQEVDTGGKYDHWPLGVHDPRNYIEYYRKP